MEITQEIYELLLSSTLEQQEVILEEIQFDLMSECDDYMGKIIDTAAWNKPELETVKNFFETMLHDHEKRISEYSQSLILTSEELNEFKEYCIEQALENEYHPGIFVGSLSCGDNNLVVISQRTGGAFDCDATLAGVFSDWDEGIKILAGPTGYLDY
jgi:hypothetical protein